MSEPVLLIDNLSVEIIGGGDRAAAVSAVSLTVGRGEIVCVVGESGSGKSVTAQAVMGLLPKGQLAVKSGSIKLIGQEIVGAAPDVLRSLRGDRMAMIFQEPMTALNPVMRIGDQIGEVLRIHTSLTPAEQRARVLDILRRVNLPDVESLIDAYPHQLSGGQRQRVMIASALVLDPALLIADEPTTALDVTTQAQILSLIRDLQRDSGTGILFITHDFGVVSAIADRVVVMRKGRLVETGTKDAVLRRPREEYTRMLIKAVPGLTPPARLDVSERTQVLACEKLSKTYGVAGWFGGGRVVRAVQDVTLTLRRGETLGIVGESGSGKSTAARCIARLIEPSAGRILMDGVDLAKLSQGALRAHRKRIQVVFQDPYRSLNPRRRIGETIIEGPMNFGKPRAQALAQAGALLTLVGLGPEVMARYPHQFSGGQRQRIAIARALAMEPDILIADEAVSALDVSVQAQVLALLENIRKRFDLAILFITHDLRVAAQICDRILVMLKGEVVEQGLTAQVFGSPAHPYTQRLFAAAPGRDYPFGQSS
jgi:peptide/nickel transport system ATP-binding protein